MHYKLYTELEVSGSCNNEIYALSVRIEKGYRKKAITIDTNHQIRVCESNASD
jgi:hypothetical protein